MTRAITLRVFLQYYTYLCKICIYANKGTLNENYLESMINIHNKYKKIEMSSDPNHNDIQNSVRLLKRINLSLKVNHLGKRINLTDKKSISKIMDFSPHPAIEKNNVDLIRNISDHI